MNVPGEAVGIVLALGGAFIIIERRLSKVETILRIVAKRIGIEERNEKDE